MATGLNASGTGNVNTYSSSLYKNGSTITQGVLVYFSYSDSAVVMYWRDVHFK